MSTKIFRPLPTKSPLSKAISYTFLDKHFLLIENMSSEASSSESFVLLLFFQRSQNPFFQKSHFFKKSAPFPPLFSPILSTTRFCFAPFHTSFTLKNSSNSLYFSRPNFTASHNLSKHDFWLFSKHDFDHRHPHKSQ